jgi:hypothetical protein
MALRVTLAGDERIEESEGLPADACPDAWAHLIRGDDTIATIKTYAWTCDPQDERIGNGRHGIYRSADDIPRIPRQTMRKVRTPLGPASVFTQKYYECTQSCEVWSEPVAIIDLVHPTDADHPTLVVMSARGVLDQDELVDLITERLRR